MILNDIDSSAVECTYVPADCPYLPAPDFAGSRSGSKKARSVSCVPF